MVRQSGSIRARVFDARFCLRRVATRSFAWVPFQHHQGNQLAPFSGCKYRRLGLQAQITVAQPEETAYRPAMRWITPRQPLKRMSPSRLASSQQSSSSRATGVCT